MNIAAIQTFLAVYRCGNLNRAAEELNVTQSAVTARLDALEAQLGARVLIRSRKGAELTKAGFAFLKQAELIWQSWEVARARVSLPRGMSRLCSLVVGPGLWQGLAAPWVADRRAAHPGTAFEIWSGLASDAARWLQSGLSDAALLPEPLSGGDLGTRLFASERLIQVASQPRDTCDWDPDYVFVDYGPGFRARHTEAWPQDNTANLSFNTPSRRSPISSTMADRPICPRRWPGPISTAARSLKSPARPNFSARPISAGANRASSFSHGSPARVHRSGFIADND